MPNVPTAETLAERVIVRGIHVDLSPALLEAAQAQAARCLRHAARIMRVRIDLERDAAGSAKENFIAKGRIEISGPDLVARVTHEDAYQALSLLGEKLDELLRRKHGRRVNTRNDPSQSEGVD